LKEEETQQGKGEPARWQASQDGKGGCTEWNKKHRMEGEQECPAETQHGRRRGVPARWQANQDGEGGCTEWRIKGDGGGKGLP